MLNVFAHYSGDVNVDMTDDFVRVTSNGGVSVRETFMLNVFSLSNVERFYTFCR